MNPSSSTISRLSHPLAEIEQHSHVVCECRVACLSGARAGFFLGDGAGVGKGRQIAALIKEYWLTRHKKAPKRVLWVSTSTDLRCVAWCWEHAFLLCALVLLG
jgi:hypothetical protein